MRHLNRKLVVITSHPIQYQAPLWKSLTNEGIDLTVVFLTMHGIKEAKDREFGRSFAWDIDLLNGYKYESASLKTPVNMNRFGGVRFAENVSKVFRRLQATDVWFEGWRFHAFWHGLRTAKMLGHKIWMRGESNDLRRIPTWKLLLRKLILRPHLKKVDRFLCIGSANRRFYSQNGISSEKFLTAPYCVDNERFRNQVNQLRPHRSSLRAQWRISDNAKVVLFCGKLVDKKHPLDVVLAAERMQLESPKIPLHLLFVGSGPLKNELVTRCDVVFDEGASSKSRVEKIPVSFAGFLNQSEIAKAYVASDVLALPSDAGETWGLVVNEAMASGLPAVVSDLVGCAEDLVRPLDENLVFRFGEVSSLARALQWACKKNWDASLIASIVERHHLKHTVLSVSNELGR